MAHRFEPYVGPRPFEAEDRGVFFGRDHETNELLSLVIAHDLVLLYAQSGAGKTSLLNAGLLPRLEAEGVEVLPVARVGARIPGHVDPGEPANVYVFNALMSWVGGEADPKDLCKTPLATFLAAREHPAPREGWRCPRVVVFDQFEELFSSYQDRWVDRKGFFEQIADALEADPLLRVVFAVREDQIAQLDPYASLLPEKLRTRYRLERLRGEAACQAVEGPLRGTQYSFADGVASELVGQLLKIRVQDARAQITEVKGEYVEPVHLQLVCRNLWLHLPQEVTIITSDHLLQFGDVQEALRSFYGKAVAAAKRETGVSEADLRRWFSNKLITPGGTRGTVFRGEQATDGIPNAAVDVLEAEHVIRAERRAGARWYELTHDQLIQPIREANQAWRRSRHGDRWLAAMSAALLALLMFLLSWVNFFDILGLDSAVESCTMVVGDLFVPKEFDKDIVTVVIDHETEKAVGDDLGPSWRQEHAQLIANLSEAGARVIAFAMSFEEDSGFDIGFRRAIAEAQSRGTFVVVGATHYREAQPILVSELRSGEAMWGALTLARRGFARLAPLLIEKQKVPEPVPGLALQIVAAARSVGDVNDARVQFEYYDPYGRDWDAMAKLASEMEPRKEFKSWQWEKVSETPGLSVVGKGDLVAYSVIDLTELSVLRDKSRRHAYQDILKRADPNKFRDKIVIVGSALPGVDKYGGRWLFELHADAVNTLLNGVLIRPVSPAVQFGLMMILSITGALIGIRTRNAPRQAIPLLVAAVLLYLAGTILLYVQSRLLLRSLYHVVVLLLTYSIVVVVERRYLQ